MSGFFNNNDFSVTPDVSRKARGCGGCKLHKGALHPKLGVHGKGEKGIFILSQSPSKAEDKKGLPVIGPPSQILKKALQRFGVSLERDCWKMNAVDCHVPDRTPTDIEAEYCRSEVFREIEKRNPRLVILLGRAAWVSVYGHRFKGKAKKKNKDETDYMGKLRGWSIPDRELKCWVAPTWHPSYILYKDKYPVYEVLFIRDIERALSFLDTPFPNYKDEKECVDILNTKDTKDFLKSLLMDPRPIAFDYETTGLKPHREGHQIVTCSVSDDYDWSASFNFVPELFPLWRKVMMKKEIGKIAQNMKFEDNWTNVILHHPVIGWVWDTMLATHAFDNRGGITSLKFQVPVRYGLLDWGSHLDEYLKSIDPKDKNSFNHILEAPRDDLLLYGGIDGITEFRLATDQMEEFDGLFCI